MSTIKVTLIVFLVSLFTTGCFEEQRGGYNEKKPPLNFTAKYEMKDCVVQLKFLWENEEIDKMLFIDSVSEAIKKAIFSGKYPRLSANSFKGYSYVFFFSDQCEKRKFFIKEIVSDYITPEIKNIPRYQIVIPNIEEIKKSPTFPLNNWWIK